MQSPTVIPDSFVVNSLRNELNNVNNDRLNLIVKLDYQSQLIAAMQAEIDRLRELAGDTEHVIVTQEDDSEHSEEHDE